MSRLLGKKWLNVNISFGKIKQKRNFNKNMNTAFKFIKFNKHSGKFYKSGSIASDRTSDINEASWHPIRPRPPVRKWYRQKACVIQNPPGINSRHCLDRAVRYWDAKRGFGHGKEWRVLTAQQSTVHAFEARGWERSFYSWFHKPR